MTAPYVQTPTFCRVNRIVIEPSKPVGCAPELQARWVYLWGEDPSDLPIAVLVMGETDHLTVEVMPEATNADQT